MLARISPACELIYNAKLSLKKKPKTNKIIGGKRIWTLTHGNNFLCTCKL